jgi:DNA primase
VAQTVILRGGRQRLLARQLIEQAPDDAVVTIRPARRSLDQNARFWAVLSDISRAKPEGRCHTPEVWKNLMMHACGHAVQFEMGLNGRRCRICWSSRPLGEPSAASVGQNRNHRRGQRDNQPG